MNHPLDKIFRDKLTDHSLPVPESAWNKVAAATVKKNNAYFVYRIAAGLLLLCAITAMLVWLNKPKQEQALASRTHTAASPSTSTTPAAAVVKSAQPATVNSRKKGPGPAKTVKFQENNPTEVQSPIPEKVKEPEVSVMPQSEIVTQESVATVAAVEKAVVIEYRLEPVVTAAANSEVALKEKTNFRKVLDFALDAKNSNPLSNLREAKDDLFAFNFKKDKQNNAK